MLNQNKDSLKRKGRNNFVRKSLRKSDTKLTDEGNLLDFLGHDMNKTVVLL